METVLEELKTVEFNRLCGQLQGEKSIDAIALGYKKFEGYKQAIEEIENIREEIL